MRRVILAAALLGLCAAAKGHVTPNVTLLRRGDFLRQTLAGASHFFEKVLDASALAAAERATGWRPTSEEARVYVGREAGGKLVGLTVFLWLPSQHGPIGLGATFDPDGRLREAAVTDIGEEPLIWVRPLVLDNRLKGMFDLARNASPDPGRLVPAGAGAMTRYYAKVIAEGIRRAQAVAEASGEFAHEAEGAR